MHITAWRNGIYPRYYDSIVWKFLELVKLLD